MSSVLKATIENKTTSVTTHFKKLITGNNVLSQLLSKVTVKSYSFYMKCSMCPPNSTFLRDDALVKCVVTEVVLFSIVAFKTRHFTR